MSAESSAPDFVVPTEASVPAADIVSDRVHVEAHGIKLNLHYMKRGHGPINLICTSGTLGTCEDFIHLLNYIDPEKFTCVAWDVPGYGQSRPPSRNQAINRAQKDGTIAIKIMEKLNLIPFVALGWSEGNRISIHIAHQAGKRCLGLVTWGAGCKVDERGVKTFERLSKVEQWPAEQRAPLEKIYGLEYAAKEWKAISDLITQVFRENQGIFPSYVMLPMIKCPALIIQGAKDMYADGLSLTEKLKHAKYVVKEGGTHQLHMEEHEWFNKTVIDWILENLPKEDAK